MLAVVFLMVASLFACSQEAQRQPIKLYGKTMGTSYSVTLADPLPAGITREQLQASVDALLESINAAMSTYQPTSELSRFNQSTSLQAQPMSDSLFYVLSLSQNVSEQSEGAFDITVGPLVNLWGFGPDPSKSEPPPASKLDAVRERVGYRNLVLAKKSDRYTATKLREDLYVDLSAIAKGYAVDQVAALLLQSQLENYLVEVGGELKASGVSHRGDVWRIGVEKPVPGERTLHQVVELSNVAVATSGDYRNYFEKEGVRFSHTIDSRTGKPITHKLASVTVIHPEAAYADAYATALMVLGPERGLAFAKQWQLPAYFLVKADDSFKVEMTAHFEPYLKQ